MCLNDLKADRPVGRSLPHGANVRGAILRRRVKNSEMEEELRRMDATVFISGIGGDEGDSISTVLSIA